MSIRAKQLIEKVGGNLIGILLNNINMSQDESYYYYTGYYHGGYYYSRNEDAQEPSAKKTDSDDADLGDIKQKY
jgi:Mrp family chromosome partitioning ATPase